MSQNKYGGAVSGEKASIKLLTGYGLGEVACQMSWYMINNYLNIFYTDVVGLSGAAISAIVLIARIWDAINDPMMGQIADRTDFPRSYSAVPAISVPEWLIQHAPSRIRPC